MRRSTTILALSLAACAPEPPPLPPPSPPPPASAPAASAATPPSPPGPPVAPVREVSDTYFGQTIVDPYRWMEEGSPELTAWMKGQADFTRGALDARPERAALLARLKELDNAGPRVRTPARRGKPLTAGLSA